MSRRWRPAVRRVPPLAILMRPYPKRRATSSKMREDRARFDGARGMYASPPVSGSAHRRGWLGCAICALWSSVPRANPAGSSNGAMFLMGFPTASLILLKAAMRPSLRTVLTTNLTGSFAMSLILFHARRMRTTPAANALGRVVPMASLMASNAGFMTLSHAHSIPAPIADIVGLTTSPHNQENTGPTTFSRYHHNALRAGLMTLSHAHAIADPIAWNAGTITFFHNQTNAGTKVSMMKSAR